MVSYQNYGQKYGLSENPDLVGTRLMGIIRLGGKDTTRTSPSGCPFANDFTSSCAQPWRQGWSEHRLPRLQGEEVQNGNPVFHFNTAYSPDLSVPYEADYRVGNPDLSAPRTGRWVVCPDNSNISPQLLLNLGLRWDYESDMFNKQLRHPGQLTCRT